MCTTARSLEARSNTVQMGTDGGHVKTATATWQLHDGRHMASHSFVPIELFHQNFEQRQQLQFMTCTKTTSTSSAALIFFFHFSFFIDAISSSLEIKKTADKRARLYTSRLADQKTEATKGVPFPRNKMAPAFIQRQQQQHLPAICNLDIE